MTPKVTKIPKFPDFYRLYAIFVKFSIDFVDENVENVQQGKNSLSSSRLGRDKCGFLKRKSPKMTPKITTKNPNFFDF